MSERPFILGLTGSIGTGKSTTAAMFAKAGLAVWDADAAVHRLYENGGAAVPLIRALCPEAVRDGQISRRALKSWIAKDGGALARIEAVIHPLVARERADFVAAHASDEIIVLDIPLLFETGADAEMDAIVVVTVPPGIQRARVVQRGTMTASEFETILAKQTPDAEKRARADYVIETLSLAGANAAVHAVIKDIKQRLAHA